MISVDPTSSISPTEQIRSQLEALIRTGQLTKDSRLPTVRQLAVDLRVAIGTVAKAYKELEHVGMIRTGRAAGTRVNAGFVTTPPVLAAAQAFARTAIDAGLDLDQARGILATGWGSYVKSS
ncbi:GntR family transcriptional regulator [Arthrobacter sp. CAN_A1]|uniref:GntR family transcriptional regulator n=1 Tax=Arthrobacter sp. CAN_A1 TaxID=2787717 RepID=UPI0018CB08A9